MSTPLSMLSEDEFRRLPQDHDRADEPGFGTLATERGCLPLAALEVKGRVDGLLAQVTVRQRFINTFDVPLEATYIFPLPDRAAVNRFRMEVAGRVVEGQLDERGRAREQYDQAVAAGRRAAIAEEERPGVFTLRVGNLMPGEAATVELAYCGVLPYSDGEVTFRFPLVVAPRYIPGRALTGPSVGDGTALDTDAVPDASRITPPVLLPGFPNPVQLMLELELYDATGSVADVRSSLHAVRVEEGPGVWRIRVYPGERLNRDFIVRFRLDGPAIRSALTLHPDGDGDGRTGSFALTIVPPAGNSTSAPSRPRDVAFVLDRSGSMEGWKMVAARRALARMIDTLGDADRFLLLAFDDQIESPWDLDGASPLVAATDRHRFRAVETLAAITARGGTEMAQPLRRAVDILTRRSADAGRDRILVLVTDGQVGNEDQILATLGAKLGRIRVFALGIDRAVNEAFLRRLSECGGGGCELVESEDRLDEVMDGVHRRIGTPLLSKLVLEPEGFALEPDSLVPARLPDLFAGSPLLILGRYQGHPVGRLHLRAVGGAGGSFTEAVPVVVRDNPAIAAAWARGRIRALEDRYAAGSGDHSELERVIVALSLRFQVLCRFTAYVAVDRTTADTGGELHRITQPVEQPEGWDIDLSEFACGVDSESYLCGDDCFEASPSTAPGPSEPAACMECPDEDSPPAGYTLQGRTSRGGMGASYRAYDRRRRRVVHLQRLPLPDGLRNDEACARFAAEAARLTAIQHPLLAMPLDFVIDGDVLWIVSPNLRWTALDEKLTAGGVPAPAEAAELMAELAEALQFAHDHGIVHGDVKPSNILLDTANRPHLVGFTCPTLAALHDRSDLDDFDILVGPLGYLAPEFLEAGANLLDPRRDVYALGVVLYELLTGQRPFQGTFPEIARRRIPQDLEAICLKALERDSSARYTSAGALAEALRTFLGARASSTQRSRGFWKR